jgi:tRNA (guanine-N7-)-methyltransferase
MKCEPQSLQDSLVALDKHSLPINWEQEFGNTSPIRVEIGFGNGGALRWCAQQNPEFPMPWPKEKHAKHRVYSPSFAKTLSHVIQIGGRFELVTDQDWYAKETIAVLAKDPAFQLDALEINPSREFRTRYEEKWLKEGRQTFKVVARIQSHNPANRFSITDSMDTYPLQKIPTQAELSALVARRFSQGSATFQIKEIFSADDGWLLDVIAADESFTQRYMLRIRPSNKDAAMIRFADGYRPYFTEAVQFSIRTLASELS